MTGAAIEFHDVVRSYQQGTRPIHALRGVSFSVFPGEFVAVCGRSGSGKSTILNIACGIDDATSGDVSVHGTLLGRMSDRQKTILRRRTFGIVFQFFNLIPTLTVLENALLPAYLAGTYKSSVRERAQLLLGRIGLKGRESNLPDCLSGGEQQRLAIIRAVINDPKVILADEPTGNLDTENSGDILESLRQFSRQEGRVVLMVTHSADAVAFTDRALNIRDGLLVH